MRKILIVLITTLVFASVAKYTQANIDQALIHYNDERARRTSRRVGRRREDQFKLVPIIDI